MKKLEECLLLLENKISLDSRFDDEEKLIDCLNRAGSFNEFGEFFLGYPFLERHNKKLEERVNNSASTELKKAYNNFISRARLRALYYYDLPLEKKIELLNNAFDYIGNNNINKAKRWKVLAKKLRFFKGPNKVYNSEYIIKYFNSKKASREEKELFKQLLAKIGGLKYYSSYINSDKKTKIFYLKALLNKINNSIDKKNFQGDVGKYLHFWGVRFKEIKEYFNSDKCSEEERKLFEQILKNASFNDSKSEGVLFNKLNETVLPIFKDKIEIIKQGFIDTKDKSNFGHQTVDILIKFKDGYKKYNGRKILGVAIEANGEVYHKYIYSLRKPNTKYLRKSITDSKRFDSSKYEVRQWDERDISDASKKIEDKAESFIKREIIPILNSVFNEDRPIDDSKTKARQAQYQRLAEVGTALAEKAKEFDFNGLKINNLPRYFLINKKNLIYNKLQNGEIKLNEKNLEIWNRVFDPNFVPDELWKKQVYQAIIRNENFLKKNRVQKGSVEYINKIYKEPKTEKQAEKIKKGQPNLKNFNYERNLNRKERQFAKLFEEIKKRTSK